MNITAYIHVQNSFIPAAQEENPELREVSTEDRREEIISHCYDLSPRLEMLNTNELFIDISGSRSPKISSFQNLASNLVPRFGKYIYITLASSRITAKAVFLLKKSGFSAPGLITKKFETFEINVLKNHSSHEFTGQIPIEFMWPLEASLIKRLKSLGLNNFGEVSSIPPTMLYAEFGSLAPLILNLSQGKDISGIPLYTPPDRVMYHINCEGVKEFQPEIIAGEAALYINKLLGEQGRSYRELKLLITCNDGRELLKRAVFTKGKSDLVSIYHDCLNLLNKNPVNGNISDLSFIAGKLVISTYNQLSLFADPSTIVSQSINTTNNKTNNRLSRVLADLSAKYPFQIITTGKKLAVTRREQMLMFVDPMRKC